MNIMATPREFIEDIKNRHLKSDKEFILDSLTGAIDRLQKAFPRYGSFLMEFIQNADDAKSKTLKIEIKENSAKISNDGIPFSEEDVKSICKVGRSSKSPENYIGYLGVGFKSVFIISKSPEIYSGDYHFKFDRNAWDAPTHTPWQIIPIWIDKPKIKFEKKYNTIFNLPFEDPVIIERIQNEISPETLECRILLFLQHVMEIKIIDYLKDLNRTIMKSNIIHKQGYEIQEIQEYKDDSLVKEERWLIFRSTCKVTKEIKEDFMTIEWERESVDKREVLVAFKLKAKENLTKEKMGTAHIGVFSFLPLKEIPSGLEFLLQADLLTLPGRGELARKCLWNEWLVKELYNLILEKCIPTFLNHEKWKLNFTKILYSGKGGHSLFEEYLKEPLNRYLENNPVLIAKNGSLAKLENLISVNEEIRNILNDEDIKLIYPDKEIIHPLCKTHPMLSSKIEQSFSDYFGFITSSLSNKILELKAKKKDIDWFKKLYQLIVDKYTVNYFYTRERHYNVAHDNFWNGLLAIGTPIILTNHYELAKINNCYINPKKIKIPKQLKGMFKIVHPSISDDKNFLKFRNYLNEERYYDPPASKVLSELTKDHIKRTVERQEALKIDSKKWDSLSDQEKIDKIKLIKKLWETKNLDLEKYDFLTLISKGNKWLKPSDLILAKEYNPKYNLELLIEKDILDIPLNFVSPEFLESDDDNEIRKWRNFMKKLSVGKILEKSRNITERIAILTALKYEKEKNRNAQEIGESRKPGFDIISKSTEEERFIEVKGTNKTRFDIFLTSNEFNTLQDKKDKYFLYIVLNAFIDPLLTIVPGDDLLETIANKVNIIINWSNWWEESKYDEYNP